MTEPDTTLGQSGARAESLADRGDFLTGGLVPHACHSCGTTVLVKKNSPKHTSIQWTSDAASSCPVYAARAQGGTHTALLDTCPHLSESIRKAVADGELGVDGE